MTSVFACLMALLIPVTAHAYVGPGLGLGALGAALGIVFSVLLAFLGIFWYPIKRLIRKMRKKPRNDPEQ